MMIGRILCSFLAGTLTTLGFFFGQALAEPSLEVRVVTESWEPYNYEKDGRVVGQATEVVRAVLNAAGIGITGGRIELLPWPRAYRIATTEPDTLIYTILWTPEREDLFSWVGPIVPAEEFHLYKDALRDDVLVQVVDDARKYLIGILRDSVHADYFQSRNFPPESIRPVANQEQNLAMLLAGRVDLIVDVESTLALRAARMNLPLDRFQKTLFLFRNNHYMAFSPGTDPEIVRRTTQALAEIMAGQED
ncbi:MAG: transporter substrate-binding domain-containing protein [Deltaproteobacteria bacterium]|nr:transporter substrate-binding domain-containing protein [Deltaproteobacteria bacterium]